MPNEVGSSVDQEEKVGKRLALSPQPILGGNQLYEVQAQRENAEKGLYKEKKKKPRKRQKIRGIYFQTPRPRPNKGVLGPA